MTPGLDYDRLRAERPGLPDLWVRFTQEGDWLPPDDIRWLLDRAQQADRYEAALKEIALLTNVVGTGSNGPYRTCDAVDRIARAALAQAGEQEQPHD